jgi:hypothetical protein
MGSQMVRHFLYSSWLIMTQTQWNDLYTSLYEAYEFASLKDEYVRSTLGDTLDHLILLKEKNLVFPG